MFVWDLFGLLGTVFCFVGAIAYIKGCYALKGGRHE